MRVITIFFGAATILGQCAEGIQLRRRTDQPPRVVAMRIERNEIRNPVSRDRLRRRQTQQITLDNLETLYFANGTIGTPPQAQRWHLDTGSSDLWVNTPSSELCSDRGDVCAYAGSYSANDSSTYEYISSDFNISYVDGSGAGGDYVSDTFTIGSTTLNRLQFGIGYVSSAYEGILGIGYASNEVQVNRAGKAAYNNLPLQMVSEGLISTPAYSIWLNDLDASTGSILFGGVDTAQYSGTLQTLPIQTATEGAYRQFLMTLTSLSYGSMSIVDDLAQAVLLDTGSSLTYLPDEIAQSVFDAAGASYYPEEGAAYIPCSSQNSKSLLTFSFSGANISVDMSELVISVTSPSGRPYYFSDGQEACIFGIAEAGTGSSVLGDTFLRSAYVVYDLKNNEISLAQTRFNTTETNVVEIGADVPGAESVKNPATATAGLRAGGGGRIATVTAIGPSETGSAGVKETVSLTMLAGLASMCLVVSLL